VRLTICSSDDSQAQASMNCRVEFLAGVCKTKTAEVGASAEPFQSRCGRILPWYRLAHQDDLVLQDEVRRMYLSKRMGAIEKR